MQHDVRKYNICKFLYGYDETSSYIRHWASNPNLSTKHAIFPNNYIVTYLQSEVNRLSQIQEQVKQKCSKPNHTWTKLSIFVWSPIEVSLQLHKQIFYTISLLNASKLRNITAPTGDIIEGNINLTCLCQCMYLHLSPHGALSVLSRSKHGKRKNCKLNQI